VEDFLFQKTAGPTGDRASFFNSQETNMQIILDRARCEGHGLCAEVAPKLMHLDAKGDLILDVEQVNDADQSAVDAAKAAVRVCPVAALKLR
jgi:ferredoxin